MRTPTLTDSAISEQRARRSWWWKTPIKAVVTIAIIVGLVALVGLAQRMGWLSVALEGEQAGQAEGAEPGFIYTCPMDPQIRQPYPGNCPICGMSLEPAASTGDTDPLAVTIEPVARRLAGITTAHVERLTITRTIQTPGFVDYDESHLATIVPYVDGRIEKQYANYTGITIEKGYKLVDLFSPQLFEAQVAFLESLDTLSRMRERIGQGFETQKALVSSARNQLIELGMTEEQVRQLEKDRKPRSRLPIYAPISGTVIEKKVVEGDEVKAGQVLYRIADLSTVWLMLELYPEDAAMIHYGQKVEVEVQSFPGKKFFGRVAFVNPFVSRKTRTVGVRVEMANVEKLPDGRTRPGKLRPGDYATAKISIPVGPRGQVYDGELSGKWISPMHPQIIRDEPGKCPICNVDLVPTREYGYSDAPLPPPTSLVVPRDAVLMSGKTSVVYVETNPGRFEIRPVKLGTITEDKVIVLAPVSRPFWEFYPYLNGITVPAFLPVNAFGQWGAIPSYLTQHWDAIFGGVREGEVVAVDGNFLIDSQMQLSGKPSLIDTSKLQPNDEQIQREKIAQSLARLPPADRKAAEAQRICPVTELALGSMGTPIKVQVDGRDIFLCCSGCKKRFLKSPEKYLKPTRKPD